MWRYIYCGLLLAVLLPLASCTGNTHPENQTESELAMGAYKKVLQNEKKFFMTPDLGKTYLYDYYIGTGTDFSDFTVDELTEMLSFTVMDIDEDGMPEVVIKFHWLSMNVLRYEKGITYGYFLGVRQMDELKKDGSSGWDDGIGEWGYHKYRFSGKSYTRIDLGYLDWWSNPDDDACDYYIDGIAVTEEEFEAFCDKQDAKEDVVWYEFTEENIRNLEKLYDAAG